MVEKIVDCFAGCEGIVEIGPGPGVLTGPLSIGRPLIALELDPRMVAVLAESAPQAEVRQEDALVAPLSSILDELPAPRGVVSNLPYYITGPLLTRIAEARAHFSVAVLMMQKEVGERVVAPARTSARGSLSVYLQAQFDIRRVAVAPAGAFMPPPKVDSVVLALTPRPDTDPDAFFKMVRVGFTQPRKTLINNLQGPYGRAVVQDCLAEIGLTELARPQELELDEWRRLTQAILSRA